MRLAIIPARGGSKRIPRKNIRLFAGQPMICHAIAAARQTALFEHVVVSTDDAEISAIARAAGAKTPFVRPAELADDHTPTVPVVAHAIAACATLGWHAEQVCCIYPAVPLLRADDIIAALALLEDGGSDFVFPVAPFPAPLERALRRDTDGRSRPVLPQHAATRSQDLEPAYHDAGQFYWGTRQAWERGLNIHLHSRTIVLPAWRVVDIDTPEDWERAERLHRALGASEPA
jgi:pseudaminic acid cytidylyltransferase